MYRILIVDDEEDMVSLLKDYFRINGYETITAYGGEEAIRKISLKPDLILLDVQMSDMDGATVCKKIRDHVTCPILFLTAKIDDADKIKGFEVGGDDYITKPFSIDELGARVAAHIRRESRNKAKADIRFWGNLMIDYSAKTITIGQKEIEFTKKEFDIIELLSMHPGQVFDRDHIYEKIWGYDATGDGTAVTEHIRRIRVKLKQCHADHYLETVWGVGYKWIK